ncbi:MAG: DUF1015 domain-containing protein [Bacillota bacterium]
MLPFRGVRYSYRDPAVLGRVIAPPYDAVDTETQSLCYRSHPHNVIRLELAETLLGDDEKDNRYTRAAEHYRRWLTEGILIRDETPLVYLYRQTFPGGFPERWGLFASVGLSRYNGGEIFPHEETQSSALEDRLRLLRATGTNVSPIFALYPDEEDRVLRVLRDAACTTPEVSARKEDGSAHAVWPVGGAAAEGISHLMRSMPLFIADGHHRYETALLYHQERDDEASGRVMMGLVNLFDPALAVLPTHRLATNVPVEVMYQLKEGRAQGFFGERLASLDDTLKALKEAQGPAFGLYVQGRFFLMSLTDAGERDMEALVPLRSRAWRSLDVSALHVLLLDKTMSGATLGFSHDAPRAVSQVDARRRQAAFLVRACTPTAVRNIALKGERMPQKSTYFYPKLPTGLVLHPLD